jgi:hypothetical protein
MTLQKKRLKEDLSVQYRSGHIETHRKGTELDVVVEGTTPSHYCVAFDIGIIEYIDKSYFEEEIMTRKEFNQQIINARNALRQLSCELGILCNMASVALGYDVECDVCNGDELEFRKIEEDGVADSASHIYIEDVLAKLT